MEVLYVGLDVLDFVWEEPWEPQLSPRGSLLILENEGKLNNFGNCGVDILGQFNRFILGSVLNFSQSVVGNLVNEGVLPKVDEIEQNACRPDIALGGVFFIHELFGGGVDGGALVEGEVVYFGDVVVADAAGASEVGDLDDEAFGDEYVLGFEVPVEDALDVHWNEGLHDLLEYFENFPYRQAFFPLLVVVEQITLLTILHHDVYRFIIFLHLVVIYLD